MLFLVLVQFTGQLLFSLILNEIFSYKELNTVEKLVADYTNDIKVFFEDLQTKIKTRYLNDEFRDEATLYIEHDLRESTQVYFENNEFFGELPPRLSNLLARQCLNQHFRLFQFFFLGIEKGENIAPESLKVEILTNLKSSLYEREETIVRRGDEMDEMLFIRSGYCALKSSYRRLKTGEGIEVPIVTLFAGSWYGDYQTLIDPTTPRAPREPPTHSDRGSLLCDQGGRSPTHLARRQTR